MICLGYFELKGELPNCFDCKCFLLFKLQCQFVICNHVIWCNVQEKAFWIERRTFKSL